MKEDLLSGLLVVGIFLVGMGIMFWKAGFFNLDCIKPL